MENSHKQNIPIVDPCQIQSHIGTVIIWSIGTDRAEQTVQTQIRLLLKEQGAVWSGSTLFVILSASFEHNTTL